MKRRISRLLSILLTLCMVLTLLPGTAWAAGILASGNCGDLVDNVNWTLYSNGTLEISGNGRIQGTASDNSYLNNVKQSDRQ